MKKITTIAAVLLMTVSLCAQSPEKMSYQAVVRNSSNDLVASTAVGMQISILQGSASGTAVYVETHTPTTNANGLVSLEIGTGTVVSGTFNTIDWANDTYFIKTETDPTGGTNYTITGTSQLMSVPYALHSKTAENITGTVNYNETDPIFIASVANGITAIDTANWNSKLDIEVDGSVTNEIQTISRTGTTVTLSNSGGTFTDSVNTYTAGANITIASNVISATTGNSDKFYLGQDTLGGIVYYIYKDASGTQHGLIVNKTESSEVWQATATLTNADRTEDGAYNTALMTNSDAATYVTGLGAGWYLPSSDELGLLYYNRFTTNKALRAGGFTLLPRLATYHSSTEYNATIVYTFNFNSGSLASSYKTAAVSVRAVRAF
jgi:hypothetical protein